MSVVKDLEMKSPWIQGDPKTGVLIGRTQNRTQKPQGRRGRERGAAGTSRGMLSLARGHQR